MTLLQKHVQSRLLNVEAALLSIESADADDAVSLLLKVLKRWNK